MCKPNVFQTFETRHSHIPRSNRKVVKIKCQITVLIFDFCFIFSFTRGIMMSPNFKEYFK